MGPEMQARQRSGFASNAAGAALGNPALGARQPNLVDQAGAKYGFVKNHNPFVVVNPKPGGDYAETWPAGEPGDAQAPRPASIPLARHGIEIYRPNEFSADDLAAELLHVDPRAHAARDTLMKTFTPGQVDQLAKTSGDYQTTQEPERKLQNGTDSLLRAKVFGQQGPQVDLTPDQQTAVDGLKAYTIKGE